MSIQITRIPDDHGDFKWALWSTVVDDFIDYFPDDESLTRYFCALAYEAERKYVASVMQTLEEGGKPYHQSTLSWGEANQRAYEVHGDEYELEVAKPSD
jgi:hypothetical protein